MRVVYEGNVKVRFLAGGVEDIEAVDAAEWEAAVPLRELTIDGLNTSPTNNNASLAMMDGGKIGQKPGTRQMDVTLRFARNDTSGTGDIAWDLFEYGLQGDLLVSRFGEPAANDDPIEVYRGASHDPSPMGSSQDTYQQFDVPFPIDDWELKSALAGVA